MSQKTSEPIKSQQQFRAHDLPGCGLLPNKIRNHLIAMIGEFAGTFLFLFFAFSSVKASDFSRGGSGTEPPGAAVFLYISLGFGFSLVVNIWVFFRISGGLFNPAVTLGLCMIGAVPWMRGGLTFISQILGAIAAAGVVKGLFPDSASYRTTLTNTSVTRGLFIEMFLTTELVFTVFMLAAEKHKATFLAPIGIGLALFVAELSGVPFTGGSLNPARSFGPDVVEGHFSSYHWIYWVGPAMGSFLAVGLYRLMKLLEYETANPGQDFDEIEDAAFNSHPNPSSRDDVRRPDPGSIVLENVSSHVISHLSQRMSYEGGPDAELGISRAMTQGRHAHPTAS